MLARGTGKDKEAYFARELKPHQGGLANKLQVGTMATWSFYADGDRFASHTRDVVWCRPGPTSPQSLQPFWGTVSAPFHSETPVLLSLQTSPGLSAVLGPRVKAC